MEKITINELTHKVIGAAIEVNRELGPGLLESVYEYCLESELKAQGINVQRQVSLPVIYKNKELGKRFFIDLLVDDQLVIELKCAEATLPLHKVQLLTYLRLSKHKLGLLINFNVPKLT
ncbi:MAG: GxxExxY protein, partial [Bacteroidota bacterium]